MALLCTAIQMAMSGCSPTDCGRYAPLLKWAASQKVEAGGYACELTLPPGLIDLAADGKVSVVRNTDGRLCVLVKTEIGYKGNFKGLVLCDAPIRESEVDAAGGTLSVSENPPFEELHVRSRCSDSCCEVEYALH